MIQFLIKIKSNDIKHKLKCQIKLNTVATVYKICKLPDDAVAGPTQRRTAAGGKPFRPLGHASGHWWERGGAGCEWGGAWTYRCPRCCRRWVGDVHWWRRGRLGQRLNLHGGGGGLAGVKLIGEVGVGYPGGSVRGARSSWSRGRDSG